MKTKEKEKNLEKCEQMAKNKSKYGDFFNKTRGSVSNLSEMNQLEKKTEVEKQTKDTNDTIKHKKFSEQNPD